ncbi:DNA adenine methylase, partial [Yersinia enterocolitica]|nr:DNA adenine methylase [Yersinia enterocolitica]
KQEKQSSAAGRKGSVKRLECLWLSPNIISGSKAA